MLRIAKVLTLWETQLLKSFQDTRRFSLKETLLGSFVQVTRIRETLLGHNVL